MGILWEIQSFSGLCDPDFMGCMISGKTLDWKIPRKMDQWIYYCIPSSINGKITSYIPM
jgi:hypothetical protein